MNRFLQRHDETRRRLALMSAQPGHPLRARVTVSVVGRMSLGRSAPRSWSIDLDLLFGQMSEEHLFRQIHNAIESTYYSDIHMSQRLDQEASIVHLLNARWERREGVTMKDEEEVTYIRGGESGWIRIGRYDSARRRSLWCRLVGEDGMGNVQAIELCSGREGDDAYVKITSEDPQWHWWCNLLLRVEGDCGLHHCPVCGAKLRSEESGLLCDSCQERNCPDCGGDHRKAGVAQSCDGPPRNTPDDEAEIAEARAVARQYLDTVARVVQSDVEHLAHLIVCQRRAAVEAEREACAQVVERRARLAESTLFRLVARDIRERA